MSLILELELLTGTFRACLPDGTGAEWPPHPERLFSALVQAWGDGGKHRDEEQALRWLEALPPPRIEAAVDVAERDAPIVYVPPNDEVTTPEGRRRQPRTFAVVVPSSPFVRFQWDDAPPGELDAALARIVARVASVGHSASLSRLGVVPTALNAASTWVPDDGGFLALRVPHAGRLDDLERWFPDERPQSGATQRYRQPSTTEKFAPQESVFGADWLVFEDAGGMRPDVLAFAHIARRVRDALMERSPVQPAPEILTGHAEGGAASATPHLAIVPMLDVGWEHSSGDLLGVGLVLPRHIDADERRRVLAAVAGFARLDSEGQFAAELKLWKNDAWKLERSAKPSRASLRPARWCASATTWASVTPVLLDRHPDDDDPVEIAQIIERSCVNIGIPSPIEIEIHKHSAIRGATSAYPGRRRETSSWTFPNGSKLASRVRRHVVLRFEQEVRGPVILGAGRYHGFGMCLPLREDRG